MSRPLRLEFSGAVYYVTARGNADQQIFTDVEDGQRFTELLGHEIAQQRWLCHGFCLLEDHYHLLIETPEPTLARGMARLNMIYSQWFGRRHARRGHLFEGRYHTKIIEKDAWLLALSRHIVLNPVRLNAANRADLWRWSSYRPLAGAANPWPWLHTDWVLSQFTDDPHQQWQDYVEQGISAPSPWRELRGGHYLGSEPFLRKLALMVNGKSLDQVPSAAADPLRPTRDQIISSVAAAAGIREIDATNRVDHPEVFPVTAYLLRRAANLPLRDVAALGGISPGRVSQIQRAIEDAGGLAVAAPWASDLAEAYLRS